MRRFVLALAIWSALSFASFAQIGGLSFPGPGPIVVSGGCSQATTFLARLSNHTWDAAYTTLICNGLVPHGFWTGGAKACDIIHVMATQVAADALLNLPSVVTTTATNAPTFTANKGYAGNGTNAAVTVSGYNFTTGTAYTQNSATIFVYTIMTTQDNGYLFGNTTNFNLNDVIQPFTASSLAIGGINSATAVTSGVQANGNGLYTLSRTSSVQVDLYKDTVNVGTSGANTSSAIASSSPQYLGLASVNFGASTSTVVAGGVCTGWASTDVSTFRTDLYTFLHTVNATQFP